MIQNISTRKGLLAVVAVSSVVIGSYAFMFASSANPLLSRLVPEGMQAGSALAVGARSVSSPFLYNFNQSGVLNETGSMSESSSPYFWLNSGGQFIIKNGVGQTVQGALPKGSFWQKAYAESSSVDTGGGYYPQNLFRFLTRSTWGNVTQEVKFNIQKLNMTDTPNRDGYSGVLLMSRYKDGANLYYSGIRQDGDAVIKKKKNGVYTTLAEKPTKFKTSAYNKTSNPNLIPTKKWMRLKETTVTQSDGSVRIDLYLDDNNDGSYEKILSATDTSNVISGSGYTGIRTDYFNMFFEDYKITELN